MDKAASRGGLSLEQLGVKPPGGDIFDQVASTPQPTVTLPTPPKPPSGLSQFTAGLKDIAGDVVRPIQRGDVWLQERFPKTSAAISGVGNAAIGSVLNAGQMATPFPNLVRTIQGQPPPMTTDLAGKPTPDLGALLNPIPEAVSEPFRLINEGLNRLGEPGHQISKLITDYMANYPAAGGMIPPVKPAINYLRGTPAGKVTPPVPNVEDFIRQARPPEPLQLPPPPEQVQLPPRAAQPQIPPPRDMVTQVSPEGVASQAPKRTIVDLVDEVKKNVIDQLFEELKTGRTAAMRKPEAPAPAQIEAPKGNLNENVLQVPRGTQPQAAEILPEVPRRADAGVAENAPAQPRTALEEQFQKLRERVPEKGQDQAAILPEVQQPARAEAPSRLQPTAEGGMAVQGVSSKRAPRKGKSSIVPAEEPPSDIAMTKEAAPVPTPASQLSLEEIAAQQEMRGMLGGKKVKPPPPIPEPPPPSEFPPSPQAQGEWMKELGAKQAEYAKGDIASKARGGGYLGNAGDVSGTPPRAPGTVGEILKSEKGQIGSTKTNPKVTKTRLAVGETIEAAGRTVRKTMSEPGNELMDKLENIRNVSERMTGIDGQLIEKIIRKMKPAEYENSVMAAQNLEAPKTKAAAAYAKAWKAASEDIGKRAGDVGLETKNPVTGEWRPFTMRKDYFPHYSKESLETILQDTAKEQKIRDIVRNQLGKAGQDVSEKQITVALENMKKAARGREGHLEIARVIDFPDYVKDPRIALKYIQDANRRIETAREFGPRLDKSEDIFTAIRTKHDKPAEEFARTLFNRQLNLEQPTDTLAHAIMGMMRDYQGATKLPKAFIPNMSQHLYTDIVVGHRNMLTAIKEAFTEEGIDFVDRAGVINREALKQLLNDAFGTGTDSWLKNATGIELKPFNYTEKGNRIVAALGGRAYARNAFNELQTATGKKVTKLTETLQKMGVDVEEALKRGSLSEMDELKAAQNIVNRTQFKVDPMELPLFWSSPEGRVLTQFKPFSFKAGQFMKDEVLKELAKGNVGPAARSTLALPIGHAVKLVQNTLSGRPGLASTAEAIGAVGALGLFGDLLGMGGRTDATSTVVGPSGDTAKKALEAVWETKNRLSPDYTGDKSAFGPLAKFAAREVPAIGSPLSSMFQTEPTERQKLMKELGLESHAAQRKKMLKDLGLNKIQR